MHAYTFLKKALPLTSFRLDPILRILKYSETEWVEFKADFIPEDKSTTIDKKKLRWNISKAVFALGNSQGGAVIIGVNDNGQPINILRNHEADKDKVSRKVREQIVAPTNRKWHDGKAQWHSSIYMEQNVEYIWCTLGGIDVLVLLIKPQEEAPIILTKTEGSNSTRHLPMRNQGDIGESILHLYSDEVLGLFERRDLNNSIAYFSGFLEKLETLERRDIEVIIHDRNSDFIKRLSPQLTSFTPLDATIKKLGVSSYDETDSSWLGALAADKRHLNSDKTYDALDLMLNLKNILLLGEPGAGKTTLMAQSALQVSSKRTENFEPLVLSANLAEYSELGLEYLLSSTSPGLEWLDLVPIINSERTVVFLDSLNECPSKYYEHCLLNIARLKTLMPQAKFVISTRPSHIFDDESFSAIEIQSLTEDKQLHFLENYLENNSQKAIELQKKLVKVHRSSFVMGNPILLRMIIWLFNENQDIPGGLAQLYSRFVMSWFYREKQKISDRGEVVKWTFEEFREIVAELAFNLRNHGRTLCSLKFAEDKLSRLMDRNDFAKFMALFAQGLVLELDDASGNIKFTHETILEYFAAEYLVSCDSLKLVTKDSTRGLMKWDYVIAFAYELNPLPSLEFVRTSWAASPLIVAASLRNDSGLAELPLPAQNFWETGVLKLLRGEPTSREEEEIGFAARLPPKYPLPKGLINTLNSSSFWYALESHPIGQARLQSLVGKIQDGGVWCELLPVLNHKMSYFSRFLSDVHIAIASSQKREIEQEQLNLATVYELCMLLREKKITLSTFRGLWSGALNRSTTSIKTDILMLLRTNEIDISQINMGDHASVLREIGYDQRLSPRIHNKLIRGGIIDSSGLSSDRLDRIFERSSIMNLVRYTKNKVITRKSLTSNRLSILRNKKIGSVHDLDELLKVGLVKKIDFNPEFILSLTREKNRSNNVRSGDLQKGIEYEQLSIEIQEQEQEIIFQNMSDEEKVLDKIISDMESPENQRPGSGFHSVLISAVTGADNWPSHVRSRFYDVASKFIRDHGSKKKKKEYLRVIEDFLN
ncbi:MAG: RNA-binding domain-containing protein [Motiliproteus sp.]